MSIYKALGLVSILSLSAHTLQAATPHLPDLVSDGNRWKITAYDDTSVVHTEWATQGICFYFAGVQGTHQLYYWVSDTFPNWNGIATQEGDQIFMHGDYADDVGHDGMEWQIVTSSPRNVGAGHWKEWREDGLFGNTIGFANARLERVGRCDIEDPREALEVYKNIDFPRDEQGNKITIPSGIPGLVEKL